MVWCGVVWCGVAWCVNGREGKGWECNGAGGRRGKERGRACSTKGSGGGALLLARVKGGIEGPRALAGLSLWRGVARTSLAPRSRQRQATGLFGEESRALYTSFTPALHRLYTSFTPALHQFYTGEKERSRGTRDSRGVGGERGEEHFTPALHGREGEESRALYTRGTEGGG